jgi:alkaline phosphatase
MIDGAHTGDDVGVFAAGPGANLIQGTKWSPLEFF